MELEHRPPRGDRARLRGPGRPVGPAAAAGVGADTTVILYGGNNNWFAAYAYWILKYRGFDNVKLLNGGRKKWELESRELSSDAPSYRRDETTSVSGR